MYIYRDLLNLSSVKVFLSENGCMNHGETGERWYVCVFRDTGSVTERIVKISTFSHLTGI